VKVLIVGAGIGGLATALFLHEAGIECEVYERSPTIRELGVGLNALPLAVAPLAGLGLLDRLDEVADQETDRIAAPERLADAAEIVRVELPVCLDTYLGRAPSTPEEPAARELRAQMALVVERADRLVAQVPDVHVRRAEDLTREMRQRHERP
jgi:2-polyprenyl-6-methoxyphenol hydroxylase-like FAD-dependent oxidoreductase